MPGWIDYKWPGMHDGTAGTFNVCEGQVKHEGIYLIGQCGLHYCVHHRIVSPLSFM